jgi:anti-repressor protein
MIQRTPQGMKIRQYLIDLETKWNDPDAVIERGYELAKKKLDVLRDQMFHLRLKTAEDAPKVLFADAVACADTTILIGELAKLLKGNGIEIGQNRLFQRLRLEGFLIRREATDYNMPTQRAMDMGLFRIKETAITHSDGHVTISKTVKVTGKGQQYFANYFLSSEPMQLSVLDGDNDGGESA